MRINNTFLYENRNVVFNIKEDLNMCTGLMICCVCAAIYVVGDFIVKVLTAVKNLIMDRIGV